VLYLVGNNGGLLPGMVLDGTVRTLANSQCEVWGAGSSAVMNGNTLTLTLALLMNDFYAGNKVIWAAARSVTEATAGWQAVGTWGLQ
jgi:hypothetical protein